MGVEIPFPQVNADNQQHRTVTLGELREFVRQADQLQLDDELVLRGNMIPFHLPDLGSKLGGRLMSIALDRP